MDLFALSDGTFLNLNHVSKIPSTSDLRKVLKVGGSVEVRMIDSRVEHIDVKDAWGILCRGGMADER